MPLELTKAPPGAMHILEAPEEMPREREAARREKKGPERREQRGAESWEERGAEKMAGEAPAERMALMQEYFTTTRI